MIETRIDGNVGSVNAAGDWLRNTLCRSLSSAADTVQAGRQNSRSTWEGDSGDAYRGYAADIVTLTDAHADRTARAAGKFDAYADRLQHAQDVMFDLRAEAMAGGLSVTGTTIQAPPDAYAPGIPHGTLTPAEADAYSRLVADYENAAAKVELYNQLDGRARAERAAFTGWIDANLVAVAAELSAESRDVQHLVDVLTQHAGDFLIGFTFSAGESGLGKRASELDRQAAELRRLRRSGNPALRALGEDPETHIRIRGLGHAGDLLEHGSRLLGPAGAGIDLWNGYQDLQDGESPGQVILSTAGGMAAGAAAGAVIAGLTVTAPAWGTALAVGAGAAAVGLGTSWAITEGWDALPDGITDAVDDGISDTWNGATDAADDAWDFATGWL